MWKKTAVAASVLACAACSLLSLDDLRGDGGVEASTDAATDAAPDALTDAPFCARADHSLCDDFDELPLGAAWTSQHVTTATLTLDDAAFVSSPLSLLANVAVAQTGSTAYLLKTFTGTASRIVCAFDMRLVSHESATAPIVTFELTLTSSDPKETQYAAELLQTATKTQFNESAVFADGGTLGSLTDLTPSIVADAGAWTHVKLDFTLTGSPSIAITFDGASVLATALSPPASSSGQSLLVGIAEYGGVVAKARFDDVACDITP